MKTKKQEELVNTFLTNNMNEQTHLYREIAVYLSEIGYNPKKQRSSIVFNHDAHNKQIAKFGIVRTKDKSPYFALRFAACREYSEKFADLVRTAIEKEENQTAGCVAGKCDYCRGEPNTHVYIHTLVGDYYIPNLTLPEEKYEIGRFGKQHLRYLKEQHRTIYIELLTSGRLNTYLYDIDTQAQEMFDWLLREYAERQGVTERLKAENQMEWIGLMNNIRNAVDEVVMTEVIYR